MDVTLPNYFAFHHIGIACENITQEMSCWTQFGYRKDGQPFVDPEQGIRGMFLIGEGPRIELLEAFGGSSTLTPWLKRRVKLYHMGYLVENLGAAMDELIAAGATLTRDPIVSTYFKGSIAFLMLPNFALIELIERID